MKKGNGIYLIGISFEWPEYKISPWRGQGEKPGNWLKSPGAGLSGRKLPI
jgi:hypothetical protein